MSSIQSKPYKIMIIAGEVSGDFHASKLVSELKRRNPAFSFCGIGGNLMRNEGVELIHDLRDLAVLGLVEVIKHYPQIRAIFYEVIDLALKQKPDVVILVDYPGFNLRLAKHLKKHNIPVIYYISPQVWAWGRHRRKVISERVDKMLAFFEFEKDFYKDTGLDVEFIGHPVIESLKADLTKEEFFANNKISSENPVVGLLPGSRKNEILKILPVIIESARIIRENRPDTQFILPIGHFVPKKALLDVLSQFSENQLSRVNIIEGQVYETMSYSDIVLIASGTATLETACFQTPMAIIYKVSFITSLLARMVIKIPYIGLVNVVAGKKVVPEFLQNEAKPDKIAGFVLDCLSDKSKLETIKKELGIVKDKLGKPGAVSRAADSILKFMGKKFGHEK